MGSSILAFMRSAAIWSLRAPRAQNTNGGRVPVAPADYARRFRCSKDTIRRWLRKLKKDGWIAFPDPEARHHDPWQVELTGLRWEPTAAPTAAALPQRRPLFAAVGLPHPLPQSPVGGARHQLQQSDPAESALPNPLAHTRARARNTITNTKNLVAPSGATPSSTHRQSPSSPARATRSLSSSGPTAASGPPARASPAAATAASTSRIRWATTSQPTPCLGAGQPRRRSRGRCARGVPRERP